MFKVPGLILLIFSLLFCYGSQAKGGNLFNPKKLHIRWQFIKNNGQQSFSASLTLINIGNQPIPKSSWKLYFSLKYHGVNLKSNNNDLSIEHVNGDLFFIKPGNDFKGLNPGQAVKIEYTGARVIANYQDAPSGFFWVDEADDKATSIPDANIVCNPGTLHGADPAVIFDQNKDITDVPVGELSPIIPRPDFYRITKGHFTLSSSTKVISAPGFKTEAGYLSNEIKSIVKTSSTVKAGKIIFIKNKLPDEAYDLRVTEDSIMISASSGAGIFYGIQSLKNLLPITAWSVKNTSLDIPCIIIHDAPRFPVRGLMLDVSRNFQTKQEIMKLLDLMALYKLNTFHFHITDDEGWRLEIPGLPELTSVGSNRGYPFEKGQKLQPSYGSGPSMSDKMGSGFYTRTDFIGILKYAKLRHIHIIPEIETPGHARAAIKSMVARYQKYMKLGNKEKAGEYLLCDLRDSSVYSSPQAFNDNIMNPALPSTHHFIEKVVDEVLSMYKEAGAEINMMHMGGDEVPNGAWERSPQISELMKKDTSLHNTNNIFHSYFINIQAMLHKRGLNLYGWDVIATDKQKGGAIKVINIPAFKNLVVDGAFNIYGNEAMPYQLANAGYKTILTFFDYFYFDLAYQRSFNEPGDEWLGLLDTKKELSFIPFDYYHNTKENIIGEPFPPGYMDKLEKLTPAGRQNVIGVQGALWGEDIRSAKQMEYMILPRLLALAEKGWVKAPQWESEGDTSRYKALYQGYWNIFANQTAKQELPKLTSYHGGYNFRIPAAGIRRVNGLIEANEQFPGMKIRYTINSGEPNAKSHAYTHPFKAKGLVKMRIFDNKGRAGETTSIAVN